MTTTLSHSHTTHINPPTPVKLYRMSMPEYECPWGLRAVNLLNEKGMAFEDIKLTSQAEVASCHTAVVAGYVVEGHVPAEDVQRSLAEKPGVAGIAVPGMPLGSPGMEAGDYVEPYTVFSFTASGETTAFAEHL